MFIVVRSKYGAKLSNFSASDSKFQGFIQKLTCHKSHGGDEGRSPRPGAESWGGDSWRSSEPLHTS